MNDYCGNRQALFLVISAPSGAGKTSIYREFLKIYPEVKFSVSYTTRPPRPGEYHGRDYYFVSEEEFRKMIDREEFVEWEENFGSLYGTSARIIEEFLSAGVDVLLDIDPRGAKRVKEKFADGVFVFVLPASVTELEGRLLKRGDDPVKIRERLARAATEIAQAAWYDYVIINEYLSVAVDQLCAIYRAEKSRRVRMKDRIDKIVLAACGETK